MENWKKLSNAPVTAFFYFEQTGEIGLLHKDIQNSGGAKKLTQFLNETMQQMEEDFFRIPLYLF